MSEDIVKELAYFRAWLDNRRRYHSQQCMFSEAEDKAVIEHFDKVFPTIKGVVIY